VPDPLFPDVESHLIDTNLFIRFERHETVDLLKRAVTEYDERRQSTAASPDATHTTVLGVDLNVDGSLAVVDRCVRRQR
jgi:hypothetical protein